MENQDSAKLLHFQPLCLLCAVLCCAVLCLSPIVTACSWLPCAALQFYVRRGDQVFRDEVLWDLGNPNNGCEPYAVRVCADLKLGADWFDAIRAHVQQRLDEVKQVCNQVDGGHMVCAGQGGGKGGCWGGGEGARQALPCGLLFA